MTESQATAQTVSYVELLCQVPFLQGASREDLVDLAQTCVVRQHAADTVISTEDSFGHHMYILVSGTIAMWTTRPDGSPIALGSLSHAGEFFGEEALMGRGIRMATAVAVQDCVVLEVEQRKFALLARRSQGTAEMLEEVYHRRAISAFIQINPFLCLLPPELSTPLIQSAKMLTFEKSATVWHQDSTADYVLLVADGVLKATRPSTDGRTSVLAYFNSGDIVGAHDPPERSFDLVALGKAEVVLLNKAVFDSLEKSAPDIYRRFDKDRMSNLSDLGKSGNTIIGSVEALFKEGMEVESLLIIDLDRCVRCGNCVRACHSRHDYTRLDRRGPILTRRKAVTSKEHEHLLIPSSCRHCRDPECMIGCPTGAIQRHPNGEVEINDNCIGCDNCARKCPYGNITMRPIPVEKQRDNIVKQAIKCNLCRGYEYANCVHECPRGAVLRVNPLEHFDELSLVLATDDHTSRSRRRLPQNSRRPIRPLLLSALALLFGSIGISTTYSLGDQPHMASSATGLSFGVGAALCIFLSLLLGARKKVNNRAIGRLETWTIFHMVLGSLGFVAACAHAHFSITGVATSLLMYLFGFEILSGVAGQIIYEQVPKRLTHIEKQGNAKLIEDLLEDRSQLSNGIHEILRKQSPELKRVAVDLKRQAGSPLRRLSRHFDSATHLEKLLEKPLPAEFADDEAILRRITKDYSNLADVRAQLVLHRLLKQWLVVHLVLAATLTTFLLLHIAVTLPLVW